MADDESVTRILRIFKTFDMDGDGSIEREELEKLLGALGGSMGADEIDSFVKAADMNEDGMIQYVELVGWLYRGSSEVSQLEEAADSLATTCPPNMTACRYGASCYNRHPGHRMKWWHPVEVDEGKDYRREACRYGSGCYRRSTGHLQRFAHPGDRNYRKGLVKFDKTKPQFETLLQLFNFYDPNESGHLSKEEFASTFEFASEALSNRSTSDVEAAWEDAGGNASGYVNFSRFADWATRQGSSLPLGITEAGDSRPCHFRIQEDGGWSCSCAEFQEADGGLCECGHKMSAHRSQASSDSIGDEFIEHWERDDDGNFKEGLVLVTDEEAIAGMQALFEATHKSHDNWTRDRGCSIHGRSHPDCNWRCMRENGNRVPTGFQVKKVFRNQNMDLWRHYAFMRSSIVNECSLGEWDEIQMPSSVAVEGTMIEGCNEWRLLHGTNIGACRGICGSNFRLALSGTGATWKEPGKSKGSPLYGFGIYLAEMVTKSDEYADALPDSEGEDAGLHGMLVCRCVGGRPQTVLTNEIDKEKLKSDVFDGPYHSVYGDRVKELHKPYREIVVYDKDQIFPEFLVLYERTFD